MPRRQPRWPSIGLNSCSSCTLFAIFVPRDAQLVRQRVLLRVVVRQEFMQRRIEQADGRGQAVQRVEDANKVIPSGTAAAWRGPSSDLRYSRPGSSRAWRRFDRPRRTYVRCDRARCPRRRKPMAFSTCSGVSEFVRMSSLRHLSAQPMSAAIVRIAFAFLGRERLARRAPARFRTVRSSPRPRRRSPAVPSIEMKSPSLKDMAAGRDRFVRVVDMEVTGAADADFTHLAGDESRMRGDTATRREDAFGGDHPSKVLRRGFHTHEENAFAAMSAQHRFLSLENQSSTGGARSRRQPARDLGGILHAFHVKNRVPARG